MENTFHFELNESNISTFLNPGWRLVTVPAGQRTQDWNEDKTVEFHFAVGDDDCFPDLSPAGKEILARIREDAANSENGKLTLQYRVIREKQKVLKCKFPRQIFGDLMTLFVASVVNYKDILLAHGADKKGMKQDFKNPVPWFNEHKEGFSVKFDTERQSATLDSLQTYEAPDNPFLEYARNAMLHTSYSNVLRGIFPEDAERIYKTVLGWTKAEDLEDISVGDVKNVIYMLYDENHGLFYVGRADDLKQRVPQHRVTPNDPIPEFTHYRYSVINDIYDKADSYLIEGAAIHDCAAILEMLKRKTYKKSLQRAIPTVDLNKVVMVNDRESQTYHPKEEDKS